MEKSKMHHEINVEYRKLFWFIICACFVIGGVYVPNIFLLQQSYVGNRVMVTYLGYLLYLLIANPVLVGIWAIVYYFNIASLTDKKKSGGNWAVALNVWKTNFEYKYTVLTWFVSTSLAYIIQLCFYAYIAATISSTSGVISIGDPLSMIGIKGDDEYFEDLLQTTNLVCVLLYLIAFKHFLALIYSVKAAAFRSM